MYDIASVGTGTAGGSAATFSENHGKTCSLITMPA